MLAQIKAEIVTSFKEVKADISSLRKGTKADMQTIHKPASELAHLSSAQAEAVSNCQGMRNALSEMMVRVTAVEQTQRDIAKECKKIQDKCLDPETRRRRQSHRPVCIKEGAQNCNTLKFLAEFFPAVLGDASFDSAEITDRAHRTLTPRPAREDRPRPHYHPDTQKILDLGKAKGRLTYKGAQEHIFPDMSPEILTC
ncbi:hypothetical protein ABVT39_026420 [Epinephelus coioides]